MADEKTFDLIVEQNQYQAGMELRNLRWDGKSPPMVVVLQPSGRMLVKAGKYLSPGDRYCYQVATMADLINGKLVPRK